MFWRFGFNNPSVIDGLLDQPNVTLEEVLSDQDIIQEAKSQNPKLIEFLLKTENLKELVQLFFSLSDDKQRLPLIACEILACEIPQLIDAMVIDDQSILQEFWDFLNIPFSSEASFSFQSSYFCKIITIFLTKRTVEMLTFIKSTPENLQKILSHLQSSAIMDLLLALVRLEELPEAKGIVQWLNDHGLLLNLIDRLNPQLEIDEHGTAQQCICEIIRMSQTSLIESPSIGVNDFIIQLTSKEVMQRLVDFMLDQSAPNSTSTLINGVTIIIDIIRHNNSDMDHDSSFAVVLGYQNHQVMRQPMVSLVPMLTVLTQNIEKFTHLLLYPSVSKELTSRESLPTPLGFERLKICELFAELLHCSNMSSLNVIQLEEEDDEQEQEIPPTAGDLLKLEYVKHKVLPTCIALFFEFPWNNFLHYVVYDTLHQVFNGQMNKESNRQIALSIFTEGRLTDRIVDAQEKNDIECAKPKGTRRGYMGHLTFISDEIIKLFEGYPEGIIASIKDSVDLEKWYQYCITQLKQTKERDSFPLGEIIRPLNDNDDDNDDDEEDDDEEDEEEAEDEELAEAALRSSYHHEEESWIAGRDDDEVVVNEQTAGLIVSRHEEDGDDVDDSHEEEVDQYQSDNSDGEEEQAVKTSVFADKKAQKHTEDDDDDDDDPFGDFASSTQPQHWEDGFASNFADMDLSNIKLNEEKRKENVVNA